MTKTPALVLALLLLSGGMVHADGLEAAGTDIAIALPLIAGGISLYKDDRTGLAQLTVVSLATVGTAYGLKNIVRERRPDKSDYKSFPSDTSALAFAPAQYLWDRYGWEYGLPAYAAAAFVGYSRIDAKKHHWYDVAASAGLAFGFSKIFTSRYRERGFNYAASADTDGAAIHVAYNF